jgi:hypothetical protein
MLFSSMIFSSYVPFIQSHIFCLTKVLPNQIFTSSLAKKQGLKTHGVSSGIPQEILII